MRQLGHREGMDYVIEFRFADGEVTRFATLAQELAARKPDVIVAGNAAAAVALKRATVTIPIIVGATIDPVSLGLASSHARPEGNVTGIIAGWESVVGKQLEFGFELVPGKLAGVLVNVGFPPAPFYRRAVEASARPKGLTVHFNEVRAPAEIDSALEALAREQVNIVLVPPDPMFLAERRRIAEAAMGRRLPIVCAFREHAQDGAVMSYGINLQDNFRRVAAYVDKIFKGATPSELPIEQPTKFEFVVNLKTAKALNLTIPPTLLARADEVIE
jgi:putative ABC transport system substrate-binding protein